MDMCVGEHLTSVTFDAPVPKRDAGREIVVFAKKPLRFDCVIALFDREHLKPGGRWQTSLGLLRRSGRASRSPIMPDTKFESLHKLVPDSSVQLPDKRLAGVPVLAADTT